MEKYVDEEYNKKIHGVSRLRIKKYGYGILGKDLDEEHEKEKLRKEYLKNKLNPEQKKLREKEKREQDAFSRSDNPLMKLELAKLKSVWGNTT